MAPPDPVFRFTRKLHDLGLRHMVAGSVAAMFYGEPRLTNDVDIVVSLAEAGLPGFEAAFPDAEFYRPPREVLLVELGRPRRGHFNLIDHRTGFKADLYLAGQDPLQEWGLARARKEDLDGEPVTFAPPEYVILKKLQYFQEGGSDKHVRDIQRMLVGLGDVWDRSLLLKKIDELGLQEPWARVTGPPVP